MVETLSSSASPDRRGESSELAPSAASAQRRSRRDLLALAKFVLAGCAGTVVYSVVFLPLAQSGDSVAVPSVIASLVSTIAVNEAPRLWTFRAIARPSVLQAHLSGAASAIVGTVLTAALLLVWTWLFPEAAVATDVVLSWVVSAFVGAADFLHLRGAAASPATVTIH